eukprot:1338111-Ditylum_brightwellii.AAC.1
MSEYATKYGRLAMEDIRKHARFKEDRPLYIQCIPIGAALFKLLISKTVVNTVVATSKYHINLQNLNTFIVSTNSSILDFNQNVKNNITRLKSRWEKLDDLIVNLFHGYLSATDYKFTQYIERLQKRYKEGETIEYATLVKLALNKYTILKGKLEWGHYLKIDSCIPAPPHGPHL